MKVPQLRVQGLPELAESDLKLLRKLDRMSGAPTTVQDVLDLDPMQFGLRKGVGAGYVAKLRDLQEKLLALFPELEAVSGPCPPRSFTLDDAELGQYTLNEVELSRGEQKLLATLRETGAATLDRIVSLDAAEYGRQRGVGETKVAVLRSLQARVFHALTPGGRAAISSATNRGSIVSTTPLVLEAPEIERILIEDFEDHLHHLDEVLSTVALGRWGYHQPRRTLKEIGKELGMTRERVRQLEVEACESLPWCLRLHPDVLWANLRRLEGRDLGQMFPLLRVSFARPERLHEFLEACSLHPIANHPEKLWLGSEQKVDLAVLEEFLATTPAPLAAEDFESELCGGQGLSPQQARVFVDRLREAGDLVSTERGLEPSGLRKTVAVAHVLAGEPGGLPLGDIARCVNARRIAKRPLRVDRRPGGIGGNPWIHLYGTGTYRHNDYLELAEGQVREALAVTRAHLETLHTRSRNLQMLHSELGDRVGLGYYELRHVLSKYGSEEGLYFTGKSRVDTVSLDARHDGIRLQDGILRLLQEAEGSLTLPEIAERLQSKNVGLAGLNLNVLREAGAAVRVDRQLYTTAERAFAGLDLGAVGDAIETVLDEAGRPVEADFLSQVLNLRMGHSFSRYVCISLARQLGGERGWTVRGVFVARGPIRFANQRDLARTVLVPGLEEEEGVRVLQGAAAMNTQTARCLWKRHHRSTRGRGAVSSTG